MTIDSTLITKLEKLSLLKLSDEKRQEMTSSLEEILNFTDNLNSLDLSHIKEIAFNPINGACPFREDVPNEDVSITHQVLQNAPKSEEGFFIVPNIIE